MKAQIFLAIGLLLVNGVLFCMSSKRQVTMDHSAESVLSPVFAEAEPISISEKADPLPVERPLPVDSTDVQLESDFLVLPESIIALARHIDGLSDGWNLSEQATKLLNISKDEAANINRIFKDAKAEIIESEIANATVESDDEGEYVNIPKLGLNATATSEMLEAIQSVLGETRAKFLYASISDTISEMANNSRRLSFFKSNGTYYFTVENWRDGKKLSAATMILMRK